MGDRSNTFIQMDKNKDEWQGIGYYSHWGGTDSQARAIRAAQESVERLGDESYFARRMINKLLVWEANPDSATGHGLWVSQPCDNEYPILVINANTGLAWLCGEDGYRLDAPDGAVHITHFDINTLGDNDD